MGLDAFDPQGFLALLGLSSGSSRSWTPSSDRTLRLEPGDDSTFWRTCAFSATLLRWRRLRIDSVSTFFQTVKIQ